METTLALDNFKRACDCGRGAVFLSVARGKVTGMRRGMPRISGGGGYGGCGASAGFASIPRVYPLCTKGTRLPDLV